MRDEGTLMSGQELDPPPDIFLGAVENPFAPPEGFRAERAGKKIAAVRQIPGVAGVHLLTAGYEKHIPELLGMAGVDRPADRPATLGKGRDGG